MQSFPKISIVVASLYNEKKIIKILDNIEKQQYPDLEVFIIQKKSVLKSKDFLAKYKQLNIHFSELKIKNSSEAFNTVLDKIEGEITHFTEVGNEYAKHALFKVATAFKNPHTNIVYGKNIMTEFDKTQKVILNRLYQPNLAKTIAWARQIESQYFYRTDSLKKLRFRIYLKYWHHIDIWYQYLLKFGFQGILKVNDILLYCQAKTQIIHNKQIEQNTYFYSLAKEQGFELTSSFLEKYLPTQKSIIPLNLQLPYREIGRQILNSFILLRASQFYVQRNKKTTDIFLNQIDKDRLSKEDIKIWETIHFRNKYIPTPILNLFRKN